MIGRKVCNVEFPYFHPREVMLNSTLLKYGKNQGEYFWMEGWKDDCVIVFNASLCAGDVIDITIMYSEKCVRTISLCVTENVNAGNPINIYSGRVEQI